MNLSESQVESILKFDKEVLFSSFLRELTGKCAFRAMNYYMNEDVEGAKEEKDRKH